MCTLALRANFCSFQSKQLLKGTMMLLCEILLKVILSRSTQVQKNSDSPAHLSSPATVMYLNSMSVTWTARLQIFLTISKLLAIALIVVPGMYLLFKGIPSFFFTLHYFPFHRCCTNVVVSKDWSWSFY